jgi:hypothetical protein
LVDRSGAVEIIRKGVVFHLRKRAHNPLLKKVRLTVPTRTEPWLEGRPVRLMWPLRIRADP